MSFQDVSSFTVQLSGHLAVDVLSSSRLGQDPQTVNRLNGESFQQEVLVSFNGYQYAVFYDADTSKNESVRYVSVARRHISGEPGQWEKLTLTDYEQTDDDGHDIISLGISHADGTLHLGFDQHDNPLNYRISKPGVATDPKNVKWDPSIFGSILDYLPGLANLDKNTYFINITYPRFLSLTAVAQALSPIPTSDLLLELRVGRSGLGDDWLYLYSPGSNGEGGRWSQVGRYLEVRIFHMLQDDLITNFGQGVNNNAYINGLDFGTNGHLHVTWTYRDYVNDTGQDVAVEAGPNGPENNHDMDFAFSPDLGFTWQNNWNQTIANTSIQSPIVPVSAGITIFSIPKYGGILNQESQTVDSEGRVHVLNRENTTGTEQWYHYWRSTTTHWTRTPFPSILPNAVINPNITNTPTGIGKRGKLVAIPPSSVPSVGPSRLLAILPSNAPNSTALSILKSTAEGHFRDWTVVWEIATGCLAEPLFDRYLLEESYETGNGILSLFLINSTSIQVVDILL